MTQPSPTSGAARPQRTYTYIPWSTDPGAGTTQVLLAGFCPPGNANIPAGVADSVSYDHNARIIADTDPHGLTSHVAWDTLDRPIVTLDSTGQQTSTVYDLNSNVTDTYGPAPAACFSASSWPTGLPAPTAPILGYLPVSNPTGTAGCNVAVPHTHNGYDEGITGLAATYWSNGQYAGKATGHATGIPNATPNCTVTQTDAGLDGYDTQPSNVPTQVCGSWAANAAPVAADSSGNWSGRLTGLINWTANDQGDVFAICDNQYATLSIDGAWVATQDPNPDQSAYGDDPGVGGCGGWSPTVIKPGLHTIEIDFTSAANQPTSYSLIYQPASWGSSGTSYGAWAGINTSQLDPDYSLKTSTTDPDGKKTSTAYTATGVDASLGLTTATVADPAGLALTTTTSYTTGGVLDQYLRRTSTTLPVGNSTAYQYYTGTAGPVAAVCGVASGTPQGGQLMAQIDPPASAGGAAREQQFVYDAQGREVGRRVGPSTSIGSAGWQCTSYDSRGRIASESWPAVGSAAARTVSYTYSVGGNPLASSATDTSSGGTVSTVVDLLGRIVSYTDAAGKTTTTSYNQAGQVTGTAGLQGTITDAFTPAGDLSTVTRNGTVLATASYSSATAQLTGVTYGNGTTATVGYDGYGAENSLAFTTTSSGASITSDSVTRSVGGRITSEVENGSTTNAYAYDGAGRLTSATLPNGSATYGYAANSSSDTCASVTGGVTTGGLNTNRTRVVFTPTTGGSTTTDSCYNTADQLVKTTVVGVSGSTQYAYDGHGNQTTDNGTTLTWDATDRLTKTTTSGGSSTTYAYDPLDRVTSRQTGSTTVKYAYAGYTDAPAATIDSAANIQAFIGLPGGVTVTAQTSGNIWSYPDLHGNNTATATNTGTRQGAPDTYDPWGQPTTGQTPLNNATGPSNLGAFGADGKITDTTTNIIVMGARPYNSTEARFLSVDPIEGGCANNYTYAFGDPFSHPDPSGKTACDGAGQGCVWLTGFTKQCGEPPLGARGVAYGFIAVVGIAAAAVAAGAAVGLTAAGIAALEVAGEEEGLGGAYAALEVLTHVPLAVGSQVATALGGIYVAGVAGGAVIAPRQAPDQPCGDPNFGKPTLV